MTPTPVARYVGTKDCLHHEHLVDANPAGRCRTILLLKKGH